LTYIFITGQQCQPQKRELLLNRADKTRNVKLV